MITEPLHPRPPRGTALTILAIFWGLGALLGALGIVLTLISLRGAADGSLTIGRVLGSLIGPLISLAIAAGLWRVSKVAWVANLVLNLITAVAVVLVAVLVPGMMLALSGVGRDELSNPGNREGLVAIGGFGLCIAVLGLAIPILMLVLSFVSFRNVFPKPQ